MRSRGGIVSNSVAVSVANALIKRNPEMNLQHINPKSSSWAQSLFRRMKFVRRFGTTGKVPIPKGVRKEVEISYLHGIVRTIEENNIPPSIVHNLDQTPTKYVPGSNKTMALQGSKNLPISGSTDKRMITATFTTSLDGNFLPIQLIYGGKTVKSLPRVKFPLPFSLSVNPQHYSNENEAIKVLEDIIIPYVRRERDALKLTGDRPVLLIMDVFKGQMTDRVLQVLSDNNIILQMVPANLTYLFQPLDVQGGPNGYVKRLMKKKFTDWYADQITQAMDAGQMIDTIDIPLKLSIIKSLHAKWLLQMYNEITSEVGREACLKGWQVAGIKGAVEKGLSNLPCLDPFEDIDPMIRINMELQIAEPCAILEGSKYISGVTVSDSDDDNDEWVDPNDGNIFEAFDDEDDEGGI